MAALKNKKHEAVVQLKVAGKTPNESYTCVYGEGKANAQASYRLFKRVDICSRVKELEALRNRVVADLVPQIIERDATIRAFRIALLQKYLDKIEQVFSARGADPENVDVPGYDTGIVCVTWKTVGSGDKARIVKEAAIDTGALKEYRAHGEQIAKEAGQWVERHEEQYADPEKWPDEVLDAKIAAAKAKLEKEKGGNPDSSQIQ